MLEVLGGGGCTQRRASGGWDTGVWPGQVSGWLGGEGRVRFASDEGTQAQRGLVKGPQSHSQRLWEWSLRPSVCRRRWLGGERSAQGLRAVEAEGRWQPQGDAGRGNLMLASSVGSAQRQA